MDMYSAMTCALPEDLVDDLPGDRPNPFRIVGLGIGSKTTTHTGKAFLASEDITESSTSKKTEKR